MPCYLACTVLKSKLNYDDSLEVFGIHGVGGTLGALLTGVFATIVVNDQGAQGLWYDSSSGLGGQAVAVAVSWILVGVTIFAILKVLDVTMGLRVSRETEVSGLDVSEHGEEGYIL